MATSADVAMVAIRRPTGIFSGADPAAAGATADGTAPRASTGAGWSAVGISVAGAATDGEAGDGATCGQLAGTAGWRGGAGSGEAGLLAGGGLAWDPLCQVRARITWVVAVSLAFPERREELVS
jgi:hypothetical protein